MSEPQGGRSECGLFRTEYQTGRLNRALLARPSAHKRNGQAGQSRLGNGAQSQHGATDRCKCRQRTCRAPSTGSRINEIAHTAEAKDVAGCHPVEDCGAPSPERERRQRSICRNGHATGEHKAGKNSRSDKSDRPNVRLGRSGIGHFASTSMPMRHEGQILRGPSEVLHPLGQAFPVRGMPEMARKRDKPEEVFVKLR